MDPLTHSVLGIACAVAVTRPRERRRAAALAGLAAGLLPDADIFLRSDADPLFNLEYHRHFTHALAFAPVVALLASVIAAGLYRVFGGRVGLRVLAMPALVAALSHSFCDVWTSYGTRWWWPFSDARVAFDWISVIDPVFTLPLLACAALAWRYASRRAAAAGLLWAALYLGLCVVQKARAEDALRDWLAREGLPASDRATVKPSIGNILVWRAMTAHENTFRVVAVRCGLGKPQVLAGETQPMFSSAAQAARALGVPEGSRQARDIARFCHFSDDWVGLHPDEPMTLGDLRYATMPQDIRPLWGIRVNPAAPEAAVEMVYFRELGERDFAEFWELVRGEGWPPLDETAGER